MSLPSYKPLHSIIIGFDKEYDNAKAWEFRTGLVKRNIKHTTSRQSTRITSIFINTWNKPTLAKAKKWLQLQGKGVSFRVLDQSLYAGA